MFYRISNLELNKEKLMAFLLNIKRNVLLSRIHSLRWIQAPFELVSILLMISFGLTMDLTCANYFLLNKVKPKLKYWVSTKFSLVGNNILLSSSWYFVNIWTKNASTKLNNYWLITCGFDHFTTFTTMSHGVCVEKKIVGELSFITRKPWFLHY